VIKELSLPAAIALVGVGIILHALPKFGIGEASAVASPLAADKPSGPVEPTIVWYGTLRDTSLNVNSVLRAWSDGTIEAKFFWVTNFGGGCDGPAPILCVKDWTVVSSPVDGLNAASDSNFDQVVDAADLANLLAAWGPAPRSPIPPSDCPLNLVNP
jgi:hypothetical protein